MDPASGRFHRSHTNQNQTDTMNPHHLENITKAAQCAAMLADDIRTAHKAATQDDPVLELLLRDLLTQSIAAKQRLAELEACFK